jgi:hypothetical protein
MARGNDVFADEGQASKDVFAFLVRLRVELCLHVRAKNIDLRVSKGNLLTIGLLHPDVTTKFAHLSESRHRCDRQKDGDS